MHEDHGPEQVRVVHWSWGRDDEPRSSLPWIGVFLLLFGGLLLVEQLVPGAQYAGSAFIVAVGLAFLAGWVTSRQSGRLYVGAILTAIGLPGLLEGLGIIGGPGLGTLSLGVALLFIALVRASRGGGWGWQLILGGLLAASGGLQVAAREVPGFPDLSGSIGPLVLILLGLALLTRSGRRGYRPGSWGS